MIEFSLICGLKIDLMDNILACFVFGSWFFFFVKN
jgi:hypothetical protein